MTGDDARTALAIALAAAESVAPAARSGSRRWLSDGMRHSRRDRRAQNELAVCAEMVFIDLPFIERIRRIADAGFEVEIWDWTRKDIDALARTGATFSSMTGYVTAPSPTPTAPTSCCAPRRSR